MRTKKTKKTAAANAKPVYGLDGSDLGVEKEDIAAIVRAADGMTARAERLAKIQDWEEPIVFADRLRIVEETREGVAGLNRALHAEFEIESDPSWNTALTKAIKETAADLKRLNALIEQLEKGLAKAKKRRK